MDFAVLWILDSSTASIPSLRRYSWKLHRRNLPRHTSSAPPNPQTQPLLRLSMKIPTAQDRYTVHKHASYSTILRKDLETLNVT